ncbi:hypothetical protein AGMMS50268_17100 [Spirochaetia bacterium]|nr:hypothetical protein AGMMS50268_17100 [Spirochaetia bacterium]
MKNLGLRLNKALLTEDYLRRLAKAQEGNDQLEKYRKLILDHLSKLETADKTQLKKSLLEAESLVKGGLPVGTIRVWKGVKHVKIAPGKWRPKYDSQTRGAKMAISAIKKRIAGAKDAHEMLQIILENRDRFNDKEGHPLPFVQELSNYVAEQQDGMVQKLAKKKSENKRPTSKILDIARRMSETPEQKANRIAANTKRNETRHNNRASGSIEEFKETLRQNGDNDLVERAERLLNKKFNVPGGGEKKKLKDIVQEAISNGKTISTPDSFNSGDADILQGYQSYLADKANEQKTEAPKADEGGEKSSGIGKKRDTVSKDRLSDPKNGRILYDDPHFQFTDTTRDTSDPNSGHSGGFYNNEKGLRFLQERLNELVTKGAILADKKTGEIYSADEAKDAMLEGVELSIIPPEKPEESDDEKHRNRSEGMKGNQNAKKDGIPQSPDGLFQIKKGKVKLNNGEVFNGYLVPDSTNADGKDKHGYTYADTIGEAQKLAEKNRFKYEHSAEFEASNREQWAKDEASRKQTEAGNRKMRESGKNDQLPPSRKDGGVVDKKNQFFDVVTENGTVIYRAKTEKAAKRYMENRGNKKLKIQEFNRPDYTKETSEENAHPPRSNEGLSAIREKYQSAKAVTGDEDEIQLGKETMTGKWKLVEADTPTASHDEKDFHKTPGFPTNADGSSINDRDYEHFEANKEGVLNIASDFDGRALKFDNPVIVTTDGIVISGNNRTMSSKIAAKKGTDAKYIEALKKRAKKFGFTEDQVGQFKNPRVVFEVENKGGYSTEQFAKFNTDGKKTMGPTEKAIKVSKMMNQDTVETIAKKIGDFDTMGDLYKDQNASQALINTFKEAGLIGENADGELVENGFLTTAGKDFIETALLGSVVNEANLRGFNRPGCKSIRQTMLRALTPLVENKGLAGYSINRELNDALDISMQVAIDKDKFKSVEEFAKQGSMFESLDPVSVELAKKLEGTQKGFAEFMQKMNGGLKYAADGEADIFLGDVESKDDILGRFLNLKKAIDTVLKSIPQSQFVKSMFNLDRGNK